MRVLGTVSRTRDSIRCYRENGDALEFRMARFEHWRILYSITEDTVRITRLLDTRTREYQIMMPDELL